MRFGHGGVYGFVGLHGIIGVGRDGRLVISAVIVYITAETATRKARSSGSYKFNPKDANGGGVSLEGGFTRNFRYEYKIDKSEVGHSFTFAVPSPLSGCFTSVRRMVILRFSAVAVFALG